MHIHLVLVRVFGHWCSLVLVMEKKVVDKHI